MVRPRPTLRRAAVFRIRDKIRPELGRADQGRFDAVLELIDESDRIPVSKGLSGLFPAMTREDALTAFRQFRARLAKAAEDAGVTLTLEVDTQTRAEPSSFRT